MRRGFATRASTAETGGRDVRTTGERASRTPASAQGVPQRQSFRRAKRLAGIAGISVAVAVAALGYGLWSSASARTVVDEATAGARPTLVSAVDIRAGDRLADESFEVVDVPRAYRSEAVLDADALEDGRALGRALVDIPAGTPVAASFVTGAQSDGRLSASLEAGKEAVTVAVDAETGLAGQVRMHDEVRVVSVEGASAGSSLLETLCAHARVIAVGDGMDAGEASYSSVTVEVSSDEADAVREAQYAGRVSLVLLAAEDVLEETSSDGALPNDAEGADDRG